MRALLVFALAWSVRDGSTVVFLPDAPSALAGAVVIVAGDRVTETLAPAAVVQGMRRLGAGLFDGRAREAEPRSVP